MEVWVWERGKVNKVSFLFSQRIKLSRCWPPLSRKKHKQQLMKDMCGLFLSPLCQSFLFSGWVQVKCRRGFKLSYYKKGESWLLAAFIGVLEAWISFSCKRLRPLHSWIDSADNLKLFFNLHYLLKVILRVKTLKTLNSNFFFSNHLIFKEQECLWTSQADKLQCHYQHHWRAVNHLVDGFSVRY